MGVNLFQYKTVCLFLIPKYSSLFVFVLSEIICIFAFIYDGTWLAKLRYRAMKALQQKEQNYIVEINMTKAKPFSEKGLAAKVSCFHNLTIIFPKT